MTKLNKLAKCVVVASLVGAFASTAQAAAPNLPMDWENRVANVEKMFGTVDSPWAEMTKRAINPNAYQCDSTPLTEWVDSVVTPDLVAAYSYIAARYGSNFASTMLNFPQFDAQLFLHENSAATYGVDGEYTKVLTSEMRNLKRFWDIPSSDIELIPMHGAPVFSSVERIENIVSTLYVVSPALARQIAQDIYQAIHSRPSLKGGDHPYFSFNAFAYSPSPAIREAFGIGDRIIMGDGIMQGLQAVGLGEFGPRTVLGHEFGHHVQFEKDLFNGPLTGAEATRRTELMADSLSTYYLTHKRGATLNAKRLLPSLQVSYQIGDCNFSSSNHHGTPNQRLRAAEWGAGIAAGAHKQGHILPSLTFSGLFDQSLPELVRPDAE